MIDPSSQARLKEAIAECISVDQRVLNELREEIRSLRNKTRSITLELLLRYQSSRLMVAIISCSSTLFSSSW